MVYSIFLRTLIISVMLLFIMPAQAQVPASGADTLNSAMQGFIIRLEAAKQQKILPRLSNSQDAKALETLWDVPAVIGSGPYRATDLPVLMDIIQQQAQVTKTYVLFSPGTDKEPDAARNSAAFQDEISRSSVAMLGFIAAALEAADDFAVTLKKDDDYKGRLAGLLQLRLGIQQVINGTALMLHGPDLKAANQERLTLALANNAPAIAKSITLQDRKTLLTIIESAKPNLSNTASLSAERFMGAMKSTDCTGLCALH